MTESIDISYLRKILHIPPAAFYHPRSDLSISRLLDPGCAARLRRPGPQLGQGAREEPRSRRDGFRRELFSVLKKKKKKKKKKLMAVVDPHVHVYMEFNVWNVLAKDMSKK